MNNHATRYVKSASSGFIVSVATITSYHNLLLLFVIPDKVECFHPSVYTQNIKKGPLLGSQCKLMLRDGNLDGRDLLHLLEQLVLDLMNTSTGDTILICCLR